MGLSENYHWLFEELADPRSKDWFLMSSPLWPVGLSVVYLLIILVAGPRHMKNRPAYKLDNFIFYYNIYQVISCCLVFWGVLTNGWTTKYSLGCEPVDYSYNPQPMRILGMMWWNTLLKLTEFSETVVFVLRKKDRQVSFLHVYHHVSTFLLCWIGTKYVGGGMATFSVLPNSIVHIVMYTYYLLSTNKNHMVQKILNKIKPYITIMQMVQFCIIVIHVMPALQASCSVPKFLAYVYIPNVLLIFYLFYDFYTTNFKNTSKLEKKSKSRKMS